MSTCILIVTFIIVMIAGFFLGAFDERPEHRWVPLMEIGIAFAIFVFCVMVIHG